MKHVIASLRSAVAAQPGATRVSVGRADLLALVEAYEALRPGDSGAMAAFEGLRKRAIKKAVDG